MDILNTAVGGIITGIFTLLGIWLTHYLKNRKLHKVETEISAGQVYQHNELERVALDYGRITGVICFMGAGALGIGFILRFGYATSGSLLAVGLGAVAFFILGLKYTFFPHWL
jgi:hypothetical protein